MARVRRTPRYPLGTRVAKHFSGFADPFVGMVDEFNDATGYYHIAYEDGDHEEMTEDDIKSFLIEDAAAIETNGRRLKLGKAKTRVKAKPLVLSGSSQSQHNAADMDGDSEQGSAEEDEEEDAPVAADAVSHLVEQKVCKSFLQEDGSEVILHGTVLTYFPATKTYRVMYTNGSTDDMTYREVVDSMPVTSPGISAKKKRKSLDESAPSVSPKKHKLVEKEKRAAVVPADENVNSENGVNNGHVVIQPLAEEKDFVWNRTSAYDTLRKALQLLTTTASHSSLKSSEALWQDNLKPKQALEVFVELGGLKTLEELLTQWSRVKDREPGVMAILKILTVLPGISTPAVRDSKIGLTLVAIRKAKGLTDVNPIVQELAGWIVKKWKDELVRDNGKSKAEKRSPKASQEADAKLLTLKSGDRSKSTNGTGTSSEGDASGKSAPETSASHKQSKSVSHLRDLLGGTSGVRRPVGNPFGNGASSRSLGAAHARQARRTTTLLDSIAIRVSKNSEAQNSAPTTPSSRAADVWIASRVKFGDSAILEFENDQEVTRLLLSESAQQLLKTTTPSSAKLPEASKQPKKSILRVKIGDVERDAIAAEAHIRAEEAERDEDTVAAGERRSTGERRETVDVEVHAVEIDVRDTHNERAKPGGDRETRPDAIGSSDRRPDFDIENTANAKGDGSEEEGEVMAPMPPLSPPRKREISEDGEDLTDLLPSPSEVQFDNTAPPPPPSSPPHQEATAAQVA